MSPKPADEEVFTPWELSELLAEIEGTTPEEIERGSKSGRRGKPRSSKSDS